MSECVKFGSKAHTKVCAGAEEAAAERLAPVAQRVVLHVPLPAGFKHTLRMTSSKPAGWVQYEATCPLHNCVRTADRVSKLVDIFRSHAYCRCGTAFSLPAPAAGPPAISTMMKQHMRMGSCMWVPADRTISSSVFQDYPTEAL